VNNARLQVVLQAVSALAVTGGAGLRGLAVSGVANRAACGEFYHAGRAAITTPQMALEDPTLATLGAGMSPETAPDEIRGNFYNLMQVSLFETLLLDSGVLGSTMVREAHLLIEGHCKRRASRRKG
jgi:hypothetical protein